MELKLLEDLICLSETRSFSRTAELRHVSQSTLSKRIRSLEDWVGAVLVDRSSYPIELTAKGRRVIEKAREASALMAAMREPPCPKRRAGGVSVVGMHTLLLRLLPEWRAGMERRAHRACIERIHQNNVFADNIAIFRSGQADLFLTYLHDAVEVDLPVATLDVMSLGRERIVAVSAADGAGRAMHGGAGFSHIGYTPGSFFQIALAGVLSAHPGAVEVASNPMCVGVRSMALMGAGVAWLPERMVARDLEAGTLVRCDGIGGTVVETALIRQRRNHTAAAEALWTLSREIFAPAEAVPA